MTDHLPLEDRLARQLRHEADWTTLRESSPRTPAATARRRALRRRRAFAGASTLALVGASAVVVQRLTSTDEAEVRTGADPAAATSTLPTAAASTAPTVPSAGAATAPAAAEGEPRLVWRTIRPESAAAVGNSVAAANRLTRFPGVLLSTTPGRGAEPTWQLWRSEDGITFDPVARPDGAPAMLGTRAVGDRVYVFGTAPGVALTDPNPLVARYTADGGDSWADLTLPFDTHALRRATGVTAGHVDVAGVALDGERALVLVNEWLSLDAAVEPSDYGMAGEDVVSVTAEGVLTWADPACREGTGDVTGDASAPPDTSEAAAVDTTVELRDGAVVGGCALELRTWSDLGFDPEVGAAVAGAPHLFYAPDGRTFTEVDLPVGDVRAVDLPSPDDLVAVVRTTAGQQLLRLQDDGTWSEQPGTGLDTNDGLGVVGGRLVAVGASYADIDGWGLPDLRTAVQRDDGGWDVTSLSALAGRASGWAGMAYSPGAGLAVAIATPTGVALDPAATIPASTTPPDASGSPTGAEEGSATATWSILHTADGVTWSTEPVADLLGVDAAAIGAVQRVSATDGTVVVAVTLRPDDPEALPEQVVLVGTPRS